MKAHTNIEYSNGDITAGEAIRYAVNKQRNAEAPITPIKIIYGKENSKLSNHFRKIN